MCCFLGDLFTLFLGSHPGCTRALRQTDASFVILDLQLRLAGLGLLLGLESELEGLYWRMGMAHTGMMPHTNSTKLNRKLQTQVPNTSKSAYVCYRSSGIAFCFGARG